jgi:hypothetical protein
MNIYQHQNTELDPDTVKSPYAYWLLREKQIRDGSASFVV